MNAAWLSSPAGFVEWCSLGNAAICIYSSYGVILRNCIFHSANQTLHTMYLLQSTDDVFFATNYGYYSATNFLIENVYGANNGRLTQYMRSGIVRGLRSYAAYSEFQSGSDVDVYDSYICGNQTMTSDTHDMRFFNCGFGVDIDGKIIQNTYNMEFSNSFAKYINCKITPAYTSEYYRDNNPGVGRGYHYWENYNQVEGDHRTFGNYGNAVKVDADGSGDNPTQRSGGNSTVVEVETYSFCDTQYPELSFKVINHQIWAQADLLRTIRYYIQTDYTAGLASDNIWLDVNYQETNTQSTSTIATRSNQSDWSQYLEITVNPTQDCWVRIDLKIQVYEAGKYIWIDPKPEVI
jgi:hypothetical protein